MKTLTAAAFSLALALAGPALAQERKAPPSAQKKSQEQRLRDCGARAGKRTGRERQAFMSACLKGAPAKAARKAPGRKR